MTSLINRVAQVAVITAFGVILLLPVTQMVTGFPHIPVLNENRNRERAPTFSEIFAPVSFIAQAQKWFADHYGFRDWLIRAKTEIDYAIFGTSDKEYIGKDGWLYARTVMDVEKPAEEAMTDDQLTAVTDNIGKLRDFLEQRGIRLVVITNQLKDKFYPQYLPYAVRQKSNYQRFDDFRARMRAVPGITYIDSTEILQKLKEQRLIFHKTDLHWNDPAAAEVARAVVNRIAALEGRKLPFWHTDFKIVKRKLSGSDAIFMPLFYPPVEKALFIDRTFPAQPYSYEANQGIFEYIMRRKEPAGQLLPPIVIYGDSFSDGLTRAGMNDYFEAVYRVRRSTVTVQEALDHLPPDTHYFIFQFIEVGLPSLVKGLVIPAK